MKHWRKWLAVLCVLLSIPFILRIMPAEKQENDIISEIPDLIQQTQKEETQKEPSVTTDTPVEALPPYASPIDFEQLNEINPHIYAWLDIPEADTSYPVVQHPEDDGYYLNHDINGEYYQGGSLFTEHQYSNTDFNDPVTIIYGHYMKSGAMFGSLQQFYSNPQNFVENNIITVYLPDRELTYQVFAATRYDNRHILDNYEFSDARMFAVFFDSILSIRDLSAQLDQNIELDADDKVLILSTCLKGDYSQRYLVFAKQLET